MEILLLIVGLLLFVALVVVHEFGHFIMARRNGVKVEEFGVGFPPKAMTLKIDKQGTEFTLNWLPLGGFVRLKGEHDSDTEKGSFGASSFSAKTKIILAGVVMNLFTAWVLLTLLAVIGIPKLPLPGGENQFTVASDTRVLSNKVFVGYVEPNGPAEKAGVKLGDELIGYNCSFTDKKPQQLDCSNGVEITNADELRPTTEALLSDGAGSLNVVVRRDGAYMLLPAYPRSIDEVRDTEEANRVCISEPVDIERECPQIKGYLGIVSYDYTIQRSTWSAPIVGAGLIAQYSRLTYSALGSSIANLFQGNGAEASDNVSGPIGIFVVLKEGASFGPSYILLIVALLSLTLAIMNTLPIPALDGGKLAVMLIFRAMRKKLTPKTEERIHGSGFMLLMVLFVLITIVDVRRFF